MAALFARRAALASGSLKRGLSSSARMSINATSTGPKTLYDKIWDDHIVEGVKRFMPGVAQMLHGSPFIRTLRRAFIPFDCTAISIANPQDGLVPIHGTLLPVGDFENMHNVEVRSTIGTGEG